MYKIPPGTLFLGKNLLILPECPSTNTFAAELSQSGQAPEGTVVITHHQTAGRGQRGNTWQSGKGLNLTLSIVLNPIFLAPLEQPKLNQSVSLAIYDLVQMYTDGPVKIKWPNDIMIGDRKTCGILIENQVTGEKITRSIVGIGLNVNQKDFELPHATSMSLHTGKTIELPGLLHDLLQLIESRYLQLKGGKNPHFEYFQALYRLNEKHKFIVDEKEVEGIIRGIDRSTGIMVEIDNQIRVFDLKEIKYVY